MALHFLVESSTDAAVGDLVSFYADVVRIGNTSITVKVMVDAQRGWGAGEPVKVTEAEIVYVNVDENRRPVPIAARLPRPRPSRTTGSRPR